MHSRRDGCLWQVRANVGLGSTHLSTLQPPGRPPLAFVAFCRWLVDMLGRRKWGGIAVLRRAEVFPGTLQTANVANTKRCKQGKLQIFFYGVIFSYSNGAFRAGH